MFLTLEAIGLEGERLEMAVAFAALDGLDPNWRTRRTSSWHTHGAMSSAV
ncbi:MAG: hypothetical protein ACR2OC_13200 [Solirubrobacterales bacterium]